MVQLSGPTYFGPILNEFRKFVQSIVGKKVYPILLILTDGAIHDMPETIDIIIALSKLPCSVIIVGVGNADFSSMEELDGDEGRLRNHREEAARDIVQFVCFKDAIRRGDLAEQVLKEVPAYALAFTIDGVDKVFDYFETTLNRMVDGDRLFVSKAGARLEFNKFEIFIPPTFVDYLRAGWQISFVAAIDYTASNGDPRD